MLSTGMSDIGNSAARVADRKLSWKAESTNMILSPEQQTRIREDYGLSLQPGTITPLSPERQANVNRLIRIHYGGPARGNNYEWLYLSLGLSEGYFPPHEVDAVNTRLIELSDKTY